MRRINFLLSGIIFIMLFSNSQFYAQNPGYYYTYDASGNRETRTYTTVFLKEGDTAMFQNAVDNYTNMIFRAYL